MKGKIVIRLVVTFMFIALFLTGCLGSQTTKETGESVDSSTNSITVLVEGGSPAFRVARETADEFKELTGYEVIIETAPYIGVYDKLRVEIASRSGSYDVATIDILWFPALAGGLEPIDDLITTDVEEDLLPGLISGGYYNDHVLGLPVWTNAKTLLYRKDLFEDEQNKKGFKEVFGYELQPPSSWKEYQNAAKFFTQDTTGDGVTDLYGTTVFGANNGDSVASWLDHALQAGARSLVIDENGEILVNSKPYIVALEMLTKLLHEDKSVPADALSIASQETSKLFWDGNAAMMLAWGHFYMPSNDPTISKVAGNVGSAPMITGAAGIGTIPGPWYQIIPHSSKKKDVANKYIEFIYEKNDLFMETIGVAARKSVLEKYSKKNGYEHLGPLMTNLSSAQTQNRPPIIEWQQIESEALIPAVQYALSGQKTPQEALDWAAEIIEGIIR
ncbi:ABC transporter substrate-binding protein [Halalkalibacter alkalisediminis]|uniref:ABC transporter substrate-binding protein n=1 Tax=Halalkalibacter alkalisediminis TaxID=935616 RepID=A0ABV6NEJ5_9BACI|nr:sugar ABC transporter substrate-binding protein [Halalkalibacter alkalisediminis]